MDNATNSGAVNGAANIYSKAVVGTFLVPAAALETALKAVRIALSDDVTRWALYHVNVVYACAKGQRGLTLTATDGHRLHRVSADLGPVEGALSADVQIVGALSRETIDVLLTHCKVAKKSPASYPAGVCVTLEEVNGFPEVDRVIPAKTTASDTGPRLSSFNPDYIADACKAAKLVIGKKTAGAWFSAGVDAYSPLRIDASSEDKTLSIVCVVMPIRM